MSDRAIEKHDVFGKVSIKLAFLLNKLPEERALLIGKRALLWGEDFQYYFSHCETSATFSHKIEGMDSNSQKYGLILWDMTAEHKDVPIEKCFAAAHGSLTENGSLVLISNNRYSTRKIRQFLGRGRHRHNSSLSRGLKSYKNLLNKSGFSCIRGFLPLPSLDDMEDIVADEAERFQLPGYFHIIQKVVNACGFYNKIHDGYIFFASVSVSGPIEQFLQWLEVTLSEKLREKHKFTLERFDLRKRGALVIFVADAQSGKKYVVRVAVTKDIDAKIKNNAFWTNRLHNNQTIPKQVKQKVPAPILHTDYFGRDIYIETMVPGILAWKVIGDKALMKKIELNAFRFLYDLNISTKNSIDFDEKLFDHFLQEAITLMNESINLPPEFKSAISDILSYIKKRMLGREFLFVWGHGDYGYGNILIESRNATVTGVIDWDGGREIELPGIDWLNFLIQKYRADKQGSLTSAIKELRDIAYKDKSLSVFLSENYCQNIRKMSPNIDILLSLACLRYVIRDSRYPEVFESNLEDYRGALCWIRNMLSCWHKRGKNKKMQ